MGWISRMPDFEADKVDGNAGRLPQLGHLLDIADPEVLAAVIAESVTVEVKAGETLIEQGDQSTDVYVVLSGRLRAIRRDDAGQSRIIGEIVRGETIGELAMIAGRPRMATVIALRDCRLARLGRDAFGRIIARSPETGLAVMKLVIERFERSMETRRKPKGATTVAVLPVTDGIDARHFAATLAASVNQGRSGAAATLAAADVAGLDRAAMAEAVERRERAGRQVIMALHALRPFRGGRGDPAGGCGDARRSQRCRNAHP
jgi:NTE family protein